MRITYVGHSTVLIELDGLRLLTDPVLRRRVAHILRSAPPVRRDDVAAVDAVLLSHMHPDHFDPASLRMIGGRAQLILPRGTGRAAAKLPFPHMTELGVGERAQIQGVEVTATEAAHRRGRLLDRRSEAIGFTVAGTQRVYFAGDTDLFPKMRELRGGIDVALVPISGWGPTLGPGHMDPQRAAAALALIEPRVAVPIHWGTLHRIGLRGSHRAMIRDAPKAFALAAAKRAPSVEVRILQPGEATVVSPAGG